MSYASTMSTGPELALSPRAPDPRRARLLRISLIAAAVLLPLAWAVWYVTSPEDLPVDDREVYADGSTTSPVYVGMFHAPDDFDRTLHVSDVEVPAAAPASTDYDVTPLLCRGGAVGVTSDPERFCDALEAPDGQELGSGDSILVEVSAPAPTEITIERVEVSFRELLSWGTKEAGIARATVTITGPDDGPSGG